MAINKIEIQQKAEKLLALPFISGVFPVCVEKICEHLGFECHLFDPNAETADISGLVDHQKKKIFINQNDSPQRQLFTLAHEIGHIILHGNQEDYIDYRSNTSSPRETEADFFAASLLMPEGVFRFQWKKMNKNIREISWFFGASISAVAIRADSFGLD